MRPVIIIRRMGWKGMIPGRGVRVGLSHEWTGGVEGKKWDEEEGGEGGVRSIRCAKCGMYK